MGRMNIKIGEKYLLTSDTLNVILNEKFIKNDKVTVDYKPVGFYGTVEGALNAIVTKQVLASEVTSINELVSVIEDTKRVISAAVKKAGNEKGALQHGENG